ncbi:MAG: endonuclease III [Acidobacteriota bacterium]
MAEAIRRHEVEQFIPFVLQNLRAVYGTPELEKDLDPLDCLIETILSQSTTNINSRRAFDSLKKKFPNWEHARKARLSAIEAAIRSGGLAKQKSIVIKNILNEIYARRGNFDLSFLRTAPLEEARALLASFKGVGPKTVACVLLFACNRPVFPIDTHIFRIARRLRWLPEKCSDAEAHQLLEMRLPQARYFEAHINLIRHGRKICRPQHPACDQCVITEYCAYDQSPDRYSPF